MRLLVTGAAGFIGSNLSKYLEEAGHEVIACDNFSFGKKENLSGFTGIVLEKEHGRLSEANLSGVEGVFHEAAISDPTVTDEKLIMGVNFEQSMRLMKTCKKLSIPFIYASSAAVYGNTKIPNKEFQAEKPHNAYARSKLKLDYAAKEIMGGSQITGLRYFNVYGPGEALKGKTASMVHHFMKDIIAGKNPVIFGDGRQKRDFVYIKDIVRANMLALKSGKSGIVNVGSGKATEFTALVSEIGRALGKELKPIYKENPYKRGYQYATEADLSLSKATIGYMPEWNLKRGVKEYAVYLVHQE